MTIEEAQKLLQEEGLRLEVLIALAGDPAVQKVFADPTHGAAWREFYQKRLEKARTPVVEEHRVGPPPVEGPSVPPSKPPEPAPTGTPLDAVAQQLELSETDLADLEQAGFKTLEELAKQDPENPPEPLADLFGRRRRRELISKAIDLAQAREKPTPRLVSRAAQAVAAVSTPTPDDPKKSIVPPEHKEARWEGRSGQELGQRRLGIIVQNAGRLVGTNLWGATLNRVVANLLKMPRVSAVEVFEAVGASKEYREAFRKVREWEQSNLHPQGFQFASIGYVAARVAKDGVTPDELRDFIDDDLFEVKPWEETEEKASFRRA